MQKTDSSKEALNGTQTPTVSTSPTLALARLAVDAAADKKAEDILLLDLRDLSMVADYFVICSGSNDRQLRAIAGGIEDRLRDEQKARPHHVEGSDVGGWMLMDYGDLIIHIFAPSHRAHYNLEALWAKAPVLLRMQ
jgi:ribosome-associated protein